MRPIHISLGPNYETDDVLLALKTLFNPLKWFDNQETLGLEEEFERMFPGYKALAINSGRSAEYLILKALGIGKLDEVLVQDFTCIAVPNSVSWLGAKPVSVASWDDYNFNLDDLKRKVTKNTRAVIIQNTFGIPADYKKIAYTVGSKVGIIEDCAHALGIKVSGKIAFFSFGRDKVISSVFGGMIITSDTDLFNRLKTLRDELKYPDIWWVIQQLLHPIALSVILSTYYVNVGKVILVTLQRLNILSRAVCPEEKRGLQPKIFPSQMSPALAVLARHQLKKLDRFNIHRREIAQYYFHNLPADLVALPPNNKLAVWLRFPIGVKDAKSLIKFAQKRKIVLGDWYKESDPNVANLPTYPLMTINDAEKVVQTVKQWINTQ